MKKILSWFFTIQALSLITVGLYGLYLEQSPTQLAFTNYTYAQQFKDEKGQVPVRIAIPSQGIDLPVFEAKITNNIWPTTGLGAEYLETSPLPGTTGNSIIYAHNWESLFGKLRNVKTGDTVVITYPDKSKKTFVIEYTSIVSPTESTILAPSKDKRITLYTCTGFLDSHRFVAVAVLKG